MFMTDPMTSWRDRLLAGDIVSFVFPSSEGRAKLEKARPSLVLSIDRTAKETMVTIAYGKPCCTETVRRF